MTAPYVNENRAATVDGRDYVVHAYGVIGTDMVVFEALEEMGEKGMWDYGSVYAPTWGTADATELGIVHTRIPPKDVRNMDYGLERTAAVNAHYAAVKSIAVDAIRAAYPELDLTVDGGRCRCSLSAFLAVTT